MRRWLISGLVAIAAGSLGAGTAAAKTKPGLKLEANGVLLPAGAQMTVTSSDFKISAPGTAVVTCQATTLTEELQGNGLKTDNAQITAGVFAGEAEEGRCTSTQTNHFKNITVHANFLPYLATFATNGKALIRGPDEFEITPIERPEGGHEAVSCRYSHASLGKVNFVKDGSAPLVLHYSVTLSQGANSSQFCVKHAAFTATLNYSYEGFPIIARVG